MLEVASINGLCLVWIFNSTFDRILWGQSCCNGTNYVHDNKVCASSYIIRSYLMHGASLTTGYIASYAHNTTINGWIITHVVTWY